MVLLMKVQNIEGVVSVAESSTFALKNPPIFNHPTAPYTHMHTCIHTHAHIHKCVQKSPGPYLLEELDT